MFHDELQCKIDEFLHEVYRLTRSFPKEEMYGITSQLRRSALSVALNYVEGYARQREAVYKSFLQTSYGSLKEAEYLIKFSIKENYSNSEDASRSLKLADEIGAMLWSTIKSFA